MGQERSDRNDVWKRAERCVKRTMEEKEAEDKVLTEGHLQAVCVYNKFYRSFNDAVQTNRSTYTFFFHSLHF